MLVAGRPPCPHVAPLSPHGTAVLVPRGAVPGSLDLRCSAPAPFRCCQGPVVTAGTWGQLRHPSLLGGTPGGCSRTGAPGRCHLAALRGAGTPAVSEEGMENPKQLHRPRGQQGRGETLQCSAPSTPRVRAPSTPRVRAVLLLKAAPSRLLWSPLRVSGGQRAPHPGVLPSSSPPRGLVSPSNFAPLQLISGPSSSWNPSHCHPLPRRRALPVCALEARAPGGICFRLAPLTSPFFSSTFHPSAVPRLSPCAVLPGEKHVRIPAAQLRAGGGEGGGGRRGGEEGGGEAAALQPTQGGSSPGCR